MVNEDIYKWGDNLIKDYKDYAYSKDKKESKKEEKYEEED